MLLIVLILLALYPAASRAQPSASERMAARLRQIASEVRAQVPTNLNTLNMNAASAAYLREQLAKAQRRERKRALRLELAIQLLRAGQTREAIAELHILQAQDLSPSLRTRVRDRLGIAYLRLGEQENCLLHHTIASCLLPIQGEGIHTLQEGSQAALEQYTAILRENPDDLSARWLLNIAYMTLGQYPHAVPPEWLVPPACFADSSTIGRFADRAPGLGLDVVTLSGGSIVDDFDNDGYLDIVASSWGLDDQLRYFRNQGDGTFAERTEQAGLTGQVGGLNICQADYDNDGNRDILVLRGAWLADLGHHPNSLLRNSGGTFADATEAAGLLAFHPTHSAAWSDYDNDGDLDLYVGNESDAWERHPCQLYQNQGDGTFANVAPELSIDNIGFVKGVTWGDYDDDGDSDLYLSRLGQDNVLYRNEGPRKPFADATATAGVAEPQGSFPTWFWDYDNDGDLDLFAAGYHSENPAGIAAIYLGQPSSAARPRFYQNRGDGTFADITTQVGMDGIILAMGANYGDIDNDGFLDCYIGTGNPDLRSLLPNRMMRNVGGQRFAEATFSGGFGHIQKGHGISFADIDNDGDQDIYIVLGGAYDGDFYQNVLFENPGHGHRWLTLRLEGVQSNRDALGARIQARIRENGLIRDIYATVGSGGSFGSSSLQQELGLGRADTLLFVEVTWPTTGQKQRFSNLAMDQILRIREGDAAPIPIHLNRLSLSSAHHPISP